MLTSDEARLLYKLVDRIEADNPSECNLLRRLIAQGEVMKDVIRWLGNGNSISVEPLGPIEPSGTPVVVVVTQVDPKGDRENDRLRAVRLKVDDASLVPHLIAVELKKFADSPLVCPVSPLREYRDGLPMGNSGSL